MNDSFKTLTTRAIVVIFLEILNNSHFRNYETNTRYIGTYLNAFLMVIPNMVMKFNNFDLFYQICTHFDLSSALACRVLSFTGVF